MKSKKFIFLIAVSFIQISVVNSEMICDGERFCYNNGVCNVKIKDGVAESSCSCRSNFDGPLCQYRACPVNNCKNGGICESFGRSMKCHCPIYFGGDFCQDRLQTVCDYQDCGNGKCVLLANSLKLATCECNEGFSGKFCTIVDACKPDSCSFRGECVSNGARDYACKCEKGYTGKSCEIEINECETNTCHAGSKCIDKIGEYECECAPGRVGKFCEFVDPCLNNNICNGKGQCFATINGEHSCLCNDGYTGSHCEQDIDECAVGSICGENGQCINLRGGYICQCDEFFSGRHCSISAEPMSFVPSTKLIWIVSIIIAITGSVAIIACCYIIFDKHIKAGKYKVPQEEVLPISINAKIEI